jgi:AcrR family transcriptional regulator
MRAVLLKEARALMAQNADLSVNTLLTKTNLSRAEFYRCFADKTELLSALTREDVKSLDEILEVAQPAAQNLPLAVNAGPAAAPMPAPDQWLERRLRVFERALMGLEKRQDKSEQTLTQAIARLHEKLDVIVAVPVAPVAAVAQEIAKPVAALQPRSKAALVAEIVAKHVSPAQDDGAPAPKAALVFETIADPVAPVQEEASPAPPSEPEPALVSEGPTGDVSPVQNQVMSAPSPEEEPENPAGENETHDFIAHARQAVRNAALAETAPPPKVRNSPWLTWGGAVAALLLLSGVGLFLAGHPLGSPWGSRGASVAGAGTIHRQVAQKGLPRMIALADNGNAGAETLLALAYLRGAGVASDDAAALRWSHAAAAQGQPVAQYVLGTLYLDGKHDAEAVRWFTAAAAQGNIKAMHNLAIAYAQGQGVAQDPAQAVTWFVRAAQEGYHDSEFDLAVMYERGMGVPQDATAALKWYLIAAGRGDAPSAERAQFLKTQLNATEIKAASDAAAAFVPQPVGTAANEIHSPLLQG